MQREKSTFGLSEEVAAIFSPRGTLARRPGFEHRPQQLEMATAICRALDRGAHLIIEAPTGVGKSLGYLIPALLFAKKERRKAVIATSTKNLQDQLLRKDLAIVRSLLKDFSAVHIKGRGNYVCTTRLTNALRERGMFDHAEHAQLRRVQEWVRKTGSGDFDSIPFAITARVKDLIRSEKGACSRSACLSDCCYQRSRRSMRDADLIIVNHSLFFSLFGLNESDGYFLVKDDFVIFDEAHMIEHTAGAAVGESISLRQVLVALHRLFNPKTRKGLLRGVRRKGLTELVVRAEEGAREFFDEIGAVAGAMGNGGNVTRIRQAYFVEDTLTETLGELQKAVKDFREHAAERIVHELDAARQLIVEAAGSIREFLRMGNSSLTYWVERGSSSNIQLCTAPTSVAESVGKRLFAAGPSVIMVGATLGIGGSLQYFQERMGATGVETLVLSSPFSHRRQMRLVLARDVPAPDEAGYDEALSDAVFASVRRSGGRALVLFTSQRAMRSVMERIRDRMEALGLCLLVQEESEGRSELLRRFREDVSSTLFGLDSFWMGVDVPGQALEHVIITRLPFAVPTHPLTEARMELIARRGGNTFTEYTLPEAILKFRQGVGRLIRASTDRGMVTILDSRILRKSYGSEFLRVLPQCPAEILKMDGTVEEADWQP